MPDLKRRMTLSVQIILSLVLGVFCGVFFGEYCAPLSIVGDEDLAAAGDLDITEGLVITGGGTIDADSIDRILDVHDNVNSESRNRRGRRKG